MEIKTSVVFGGGQKNISVYGSIDTAPVCSSLGRNTYKGVAKKANVYPVLWNCSGTMQS